MKTSEGSRGWGNPNHYNTRTDSNMFTVFLNKVKENRFSSRVKIFLHLLNIWGFKKKKNLRFPKLNEGEIHKKHTTWKPFHNQKDSWDWCHFRWHPPKMLVLTGRRLELLLWSKGFNYSLQHCALFFLEWITQKISALFGKK